MPTYLLVNADDFGLHQSINRGIIRAFREGIVRSTSLVPVGRAYEDAVSCARANPGLDIGVHLTAVEERPLLAGRDSGLVDREGRFFRNIYRAGLAVIGGSRRLLQLEREFRAQIERVVSEGLRISHLDTHCHLHALPPVFDVVIKLAEEFRISWVRRPGQRALLPGESGSLFRLAQVALLTRMSSASIRRWSERTTVRFPDQTLGMVASGHLTQHYLLQTVQTLSPGVHELMCHPGLDAADLRAVYRWRYGWEDELAALTAPSVKDSLERNGIHVVGFSQLSDAGQAVRV